MAGPCLCSVMHLSWPLSPQRNATATQSGTLEAAPLALLMAQMLTHSSSAVSLGCHSARSLAAEARLRCRAGIHLLNGVRTLHCAAQSAVVYDVWRPGVMQVNELRRTVRGMSWLSLIAASAARDELAAPIGASATLRLL